MSILRTEAGLRTCGCPPESRVDGACGCGNGGGIVRDAARVTDARIMRSAPGMVRDDRIDRTPSRGGDSHITRTGNARPRNIGGVRPRGQMPVGMGVPPGGGAGNVPTPPERRPGSGGPSPIWIHGYPKKTVDTEDALESFACESRTYTATRADQALHVEPVTSSFYVCGAAAAVPFGSAEFSEIDAIVLDYMTFRDIPNGSVAVISGDGRLVYAKAFTNRTAASYAREPLTVATPRSVFRLGSVSKIITTLGVMRCLEDGLEDGSLPNGLETTLGELGLDFLCDAVLAAAVLTEIGATGRRAHPARMAGITIRQLLSHTSGILETHADTPRKYQGLGVGPTPGTAYDWYKEDQTVVELMGHHLPMTLEEMLYCALSTPLNLPGDWWAYADANFILAGYLIASVTGRDYESWIKEKVLTPCAAFSTRVGQGDRFAADEVSYYGGAWPWEGEALHAGKPVPISPDALIEDSFFASVMAPSLPETYAPRGTRNLAANAGGSGWTASAYDVARLLRNTFCLPDGGTAARVVTTASLAEMCKVQARTTTSQHGLGFFVSTAGATNPTVDKHGHGEGIQAYVRHKGALPDATTIPPSADYSVVYLFNRSYTGWDDEAPTEGYFKIKLLLWLNAKRAAGSPGWGSDDLWTKV